jgi:hypothetical protein
MHDCLFPHIVVITAHSCPQLQALSRMIRAGGGTVATQKDNAHAVDLAVLGPLEPVAKGQELPKVVV